MPIFIPARSHRSRKMPSDIVQIVSSLGGDANVFGLYDARVGITTATGVSQWDDARGASGFGPSLTQGTGGAQPAYSASAATVTFDGTDDSIRSAAGWNGITADCAIVLVATLPTTGAVNTERMATLAEGGGTSLLESRRLVNDGNLSVAAGSSNTAVSTVGLTGTRVIHAARENSGGGNTRSSARIGAGAEATANVAQADQTAGSFVIGANAGVTLFADMVVRAAIVFKGNYRATTLYATAINEWAAMHHGATL